MSSIILDSNIYIALYYQNDNLHKNAMFLFNDIKRSKIITPYCVISEVITVLANRKQYTAIGHFIDDLENAPNIRMIDNNYQPELNFYKKINSKLSFTDISLIYLAKKFKTQLITFDKKLNKLYQKIT